VETAVAPDSYAEVKQAEKAGAFGRPGPTYVPLTSGPMEVDYKLVPDRDLNGAGLVYFANYPLILDIAEREVLGKGELPLSDSTTGCTGGRTSAS
jgi:probable biosynthetic protein (TIGR04098 family)